MRNKIIFKTDNGDMKGTATPSGGQWDPHESLVAQELSVQLHEMFFFPLHQPGEVPML